MLGQRAGSPIAEYARVQRPEPKTGQPKVQLYCKDDSLCPSCESDGLQHNVFGQKYAGKLQNDVQ